MRQWPFNSIFLSHSHVPWGMCITAIVHPEIISETKSFLKEYLGNQCVTGKTFLTHSAKPQALNNEPHFSETVNTI